MSDGLISYHEWYPTLQLLQAPYDESSLYQETSQLCGGKQLQWYFITSVRYFDIHTNVFQENGEGWNTQITQWIRITKAGFLRPTRGHGFQKLNLS